MSRDKEKLYVGRHEEFTAYFAAFVFCKRAFGGNNLRQLTTMIIEEGADPLTEDQMWRMTFSKAITEEWEKMFPEIPYSTDWEVILKTSNVMVYGPSNEVNSDGD
jgi:hypothetical protein